MLIHYIFWKIKRAYRSYRIWSVQQRIAAAEAEYKRLMGGRLPDKTGVVERWEMGDAFKKPEEG